MKNPRTFEVKTRLNADEVLALSRACNEADISHSRLLRELALDWVRQHQSIEGTSQDKRPKVGPKWALPVANSRVNFGVAPVRLRI